MEPFRSSSGWPVASFSFCLLAVLLIGVAIVTFKSSHTNEEDVAIALSALGLSFFIFGLIAVINRLHRIMIAVEYVARAATEEGIRESFSPSNIQTRIAARQERDVR